MRLNVLHGINEHFFYSERADVYRPESVVQPNGGTKQVLHVVFDLVEIPCRVSIDDPDRNQREVDQNPVEVRGTLFCASTWSLSEGDIIRVTDIDGEVTTWVGGAPAKYPNGLQIKVVRRGRA